MYKFAREPKWLLSHLFVIALVGTMIFLGFWQLNRLSERKDTNALIAARADADPTTLRQALASEMGGDGSLGDVRYLKVEVAGEYVGDTIFIDNRSFEGSPGSWLATLFALCPSAGGKCIATDNSDEEFVLVVRGFVGRSTALNSAPADLAAPDGEQTLVGLLQPGATGGAFAIGREGLAAISRPNINAIADKFGVEMEDTYLQLESPIEPLLAPVPRPAINNGSHLSYAFQWFTFSAIGFFGYLLILRRRARSPNSGGADAPDRGKTTNGEVSPSG